MSRCTICAHPDRAAIDRALRTATAHLAIATQYGLHRDSVRRHATNHLNATTTIATTKAPRPRTTRRATPPDRAHTPSPPRTHRTQGERIDDPIARAATQTAFLAAFLELANEHGACRAVSLDRTTVRWWAEHDEGFGLRYEQTKAGINDTLLGEAYRRGVQGVAEPVISQGKLVYGDDGRPLTVQKYSDRMLELLLKARRPEFRDKSQVDLTSNGQTVGQSLPLADVATIQAQVAQQLREWRQERGRDAHSDDLGPR